MTANVEGVLDAVEVSYAWEELVNDDWTGLPNETPSLSIESEEVDIRRYKVTVDADGAMATAELDVIWGEWGIFGAFVDEVADWLEAEDQIGPTRTMMLTCIEEGAASTPGIDLENRPPIDEIYLGGYSGEMIPVIDGCDAEVGYFDAVHESAMAGVAAVREQNPLYDKWLNTEDGIAYATGVAAPDALRDSLGVLYTLWEQERAADAAE